MSIFWCLVDPPKTCSFVGFLKLCHILLRSSLGVHLRSGGPGPITRSFQWITHNCNTVIFHGSEGVWFHNRYKNVFGAQPVGHPRSWVPRSLENLFTWKDIEDKGRGRRGVVKEHTDEFWGHCDALEHIKRHQDQNSSNQHTCVIYGWLVMSIHKNSVVKTGLKGNDTEIASVGDLSILMRYRYMKIFLWPLFCDGMICGPLYVVDGSPLYGDPAEVLSADQPCALDTCNTTRSFTHESNTCVSRRLAFLAFRGLPTIQLDGKNYH